MGLYNRIVWDCITGYTQPWGATSKHFQSGYNVNVKCTPKMHIFGNFGKFQNVQTSTQYPKFTNRYTQKIVLTNILNKLI